jgi:hypothetical protein
MWTLLKEVQNKGSFETHIGLFEEKIGHTVFRGFFTCWRPKLPFPQPGLRSRIIFMRFRLRAKIVIRLRSYPSIKQVKNFKRSKGNIRSDIIFSSDSL